MKKITLCMPVYNTKKTLRAALDSVIGQTYPVEKFKIFDNASTDGSLEIIEEYAQKYPHIEVHKSTVNVGLEANLTRCMLAAEYDYCGVVHSDDVYEKNFVEVSIKYLEKNPDCVASFTISDEIDENGNFLRQRYTPPHLKKMDPATIDKSEFLSLILDYSNFITCPSVIVKSDVYREKVKVCNVSDFKSGADLEMWFRLVEFGKILFVPFKLMNYRISNSSFSYRLSQVRTERHDIFIVLDHYINKNSLSKSDTENYQFLNLKDQAFRNYKIFKTKKNLPFVKDTKFDLGLVLKRLTKSKWHFKIASSILAVTVLIKALEIIGWRADEKNSITRS